MLGIRGFFHKIKIGFIRAGEPSLPYVDSVKRYGNYGEDEFIEMIRDELPSCEIKRNVMVSSPKGNAEIDCMLLYEDKLFAIEVKRWKGRIIEYEKDFLQVKTDRYTGERYNKIIKSPFNQIRRAIYLLRQQIQVNAWVNAIVFFEDDELESITVSSKDAWFDDLQNLKKYICNSGKQSLGKFAREFFDKCVPADYLYARSWDKSLHCVIDRKSLHFKTVKGAIGAEDIVSINIKHRWSYDDLFIRMLNGTTQKITVENEKIRVYENGIAKSYSICKLDYIEFGRANKG